MPRTRITSKGQVTIPVEVRQQLDLRPGDELVFEVEGEGARVYALRPPRLSQLRGALRSSVAFPGRDEVREETGRRLGEALASETTPTEGTGT